MLRKVLTFAQAAERLPRRRRGRKAAISTLYRYARTGLHGELLRVIQTPGGLGVTEDDLEDFFRRVAAARGYLPSEPDGRQPTTASEAGESSVDQALRERKLLGPKENNSQY
jgi:hypothetical protein